MIQIRLLAPAALAGIFISLALAVPAFAEETKVTSPKPPGPAPQIGKFRVYVGTYTKPGKSEGIYQLDLDATTGMLSEARLAVACGNPSFLAIHPTARFLYATGEMDDGQGNKIGAVQAFAIDPKTKQLSPLNHEPVGGQGTCHVVVDRDGKHAVAANYASGSAAVLPIQEDGRLGKMSSLVQHRGSSVNTERQAGPHAHSINLDGANRLAFVADLGLDKILVYQFDPASGMLTAHDPPSASVAPGSGPRHFAIHPDGGRAYVINEMSNTITAFGYDPAKGVLKETQTISTLPEGYTGTSYAAEVQVHPSGKYVYGSNRGHDSIAVFKIDPQSGTLTLSSHQSESIKTPRNFGIDPTGRVLVVANQDSDSLVAFRIDPETGNLTPSGSIAKVPTPVCVKMTPAVN